MLLLKFISLFLVIALTNCSSNNQSQIYKKINKSFYGGIYKVGDPYLIDEKIYYPRIDKEYDEIGEASWYGEEFHNKLTANGETFNMNKVSAAHRTLPLPSKVKVTNLSNNKSLVMRVNDRGPFTKDRIIDLSMRAAELLGFKEKGTQRVRVQYLSGANIYDKFGNLVTKKKFIKQENYLSLKNQHSFSIVVGSYKRKENVEKIQIKLKNFNKLSVDKKVSSNGDVYKIYIGPYLNKDYVLKLQETINFMGFKDTRIEKN